MKRQFLIPFLVPLLFCMCKSDRKSVSESTADKFQKPDEKSVTMYPNLSQYIETLNEDLDSIPAERKEKLKETAAYISSRISSGATARLIFICTHNSRRSHLSQIWAQTAAAHYGLGDKIKTYSGGTEATAFNPRAVAAIERAGFTVENTGGNNPVYKVNFAEGSEPIHCFSKKYDDPSNPQADFAAIMTCSQADENCPLVPGAEFRVAIPYQDPKESDGTPEEAATYDKRTGQIAGEMLFLMAEVKKQVNRI